LDFLQSRQILILKNTPGIPVVKIFAGLDLDEKSWFSFGHYTKEIRKTPEKRNKNQTSAAEPSSG